MKRIIRGRGEIHSSIIYLRNSRNMVPPVLKVLAINGLSLVVEESKLSGETKEGNEDGEDDELTGVAGYPSQEEPVNPWVIWLP